MYNSLVNMKTLYALLICTVLLSYGCASDNKKPSDDSLMAAEAYDHINTVREAYESKNEYMLTHLVPELSRLIIRDLTFEKAELSFKTRLVRITESSIVINLNWRGSWWVDGRDKIEHSGVADFVINRQTMILSHINGDSPFLTPAYRK